MGLLGVSRATFGAQTFAGDYPVVRLAKLASTTG
jgi:hypothetical protein